MLVDETISFLDALCAELRGREPDPSEVEGYPVFDYSSSD